MQEFFELPGAHQIHVGLRTFLGKERKSFEPPKASTNRIEFQREAEVLASLNQTAANMAPEQAKGRTADKRSDVWAFGCVLDEMLTI